MRLEIPVGLPRMAALGCALLQSCFQTLFHEPALHPVDFLHADKQHIRDGPEPVKGPLRRAPRARP